MNIQNNFLKGRMNKSLDERLLPPGEYRDALNIEVSSVEGTNVGAVKNVQGNSQLTTLEYDAGLGPVPLSPDAVCIGAISDDSRGVMYWFVHSPTDGVDMIVSYNEKISALTYHVISTTILNFNPQYLITGINLVDDLLIWTDNYNQPRKININRSYPYPVLGFDQITEQDISLIVTPPIQSPGISFDIEVGFEDYMVDKFICFAYRYKYLDGEYSALSQFTDAAFVPKGFSFDSGTTFTNSGMTNLFNKVNISIDVGSSNVVGIDLCFKLNDSNIINLIEKFDKASMGWPDSTTQVVSFSAGQIFGTLTESELLRVYDNVPRKARAQTLMGNRIMFGNYVDGYDITSSTGEPINIDYTVSVQSEAVVPAGAVSNGGSTDNTSYTAAPVQPATAIFNELNMDFTGITFQTGDVLGIQLQMIAAETYNGIGLPQAVNPTPFVIFTAITLQNDYVNAAAFAASAEFLAGIGTALNIQPIATACQGATLSDKFACAATNVLGVSLAKTGYGFAATTPNEPIIITSPVLANPDIIRLTIPVMQFGPAGPGSYWQYYAYLNNFTLPVGLSTSITYVKSHKNKSLHTSRSYDLGMVYMDEFGRNTTVLVCETNSVFVDPVFSVNRNYLRAEINHFPPPWASRYKFVIKESSGAYNTVYTDEYYQTAALGYWFRLEGQNQLIPRVGEYLIPKLDGGGALTTYARVEVLDLQSQPSAFIASAPAGLYMKLPVGAFDPGSGTDLLVFETESSDVIESLYYEGSQSFAIVGGLHQGNIQNQTSLLPAICDLSFFNCLSFGNGVEGYKIEDGITSRSLVLGNRFNAESEENYEETRRGSSITYSGVYRGEANLNKLNQFNLALANYKDIERVFGSIQTLFGRQTDVLVLQEDKISYVLAGKNLLSDAAAGGSITSVPEVLGTQMARLEDYGIGLNPESFASFGYEKYFTDAKRGAVIRLMGSSYSNDQLEVVSEYGMGSWFRDRFIETTDKQKLGSYDPFLDQYILSIKDVPVESPEIVVGCGTYIESSVSSDPMVFYLDAGTKIGNIQLVYTIGLIAGAIDFVADFNGTVVSTGPVTTSGTLIVNKLTAYPTRIAVQVVPSLGGGNFTLQIICP